MFTGSIPLPSGGSGSGNGGGTGNGGAVGPARTPTPSNVVIVPPKTDVPGTLVFVKQGNLWTQTGNKAVQITTSGAGSMPSWSPDGAWIYYIESVHDQGFFPGGSEGPSRYTMDYPVLTRIHPDGTGAEKLLSGRYRQGSYTWFFWIRQPRVSPDGRTVAIASDGPDPTKSDVVLQTYDVKTDKTKRLGLGENPPLGHQDPAWRPDGGSAPLREERSRRDARRADHLPLRPEVEEDERPQRARLHAAVLVARRPLPGRDEDEPARAPTSPSSTPGTATRSCA